MISVRGTLSHGGLRKGNPDSQVMTGFYRSPGIADDLLAFAVGTSDRDEGHEPLLAFGGRQEETQCAINLSPSPLLEHYRRTHGGLYEVPGYST
jgi:hypothetical protein